MRQINFNLYPPDGYTFKETDGVTFRSDSWKHLEELVIDYRTRAGRPVGNVMDDIMAQVCAKVPSYCNETSGGTVVIHQPSGMSLNQRTLAWLAAMLGYFRIKAIRRTDQAEAARRAAICKTCPMQEALNTSCGACVSMVDSARRQIENGDPLRHQNLHPCKVLGEDMVLSVEINQEPADNAQLPGHCWRKKK